MIACFHKRAGSNKGGSVNISVLGLGAPVVDRMIEVDDSFLLEIFAAKGGQEPISMQELHDLIDLAPSPLLMSAGGSCSNTLKALAKLGFSTALIGKRGADDLGRFYKKRMDDYGVELLIKQCSKQATAQALCFLTQDRERTMRTFLGACVDIQADEIKPAFFKRASCFHLEAYSFYNINLAMRALELAKEKGLLISLDLSSFEVVLEFKTLLPDLLKKYVDVVFANEQEVHVLCNRSDQEACLELGKFCPSAVLLQGERGAFVCHKGRLFHVDAHKVPCIDTTGAGDHFIAGFLSQILQNASAEEAASFATLVASFAVQSLGAEIKEAFWKKLRSV